MQIKLRKNLRFLNNMFPLVGVPSGRCCHRTSQDFPLVGVVTVPGRIFLL